MHVFEYLKEAQQALEQTALLKEKLLLASESQKMAGEQEQEFERLIAGLEDEMKTLKDNEAKQMVCLCNILGTGHIMLRMTNQSFGEW